MEKQAAAAAEWTYLHENRIPTRSSDLKLCCLINPANNVVAKRRRTQNFTPDLMYVCLSIELDVVQLLPYLGLYILLYFCMDVFETACSKFTLGRWNILERKSKAIPQLTLMPTYMCMYVYALIYECVYEVRPSAANVSFRNYLSCLELSALAKCVRGNV